MVTRSLSARERPHVGFLQPLRLPLIRP